MRELIELIFSQNGLLSRSLANFEQRSCQKEMAQCILEAFEKEQIALIEAGTGTGKSLAYLVPAIFWALKHQEKTVIATHTIALQEQLLYKDIPFLLKTMDVEIKACLVKGMSNYLCLRKLRELQEQPLLFSSEPIAKLHASEKSMILANPCQNLLADSTGSGENILKKVEEPPLGQGATKGRFCAAKSFAIGSVDETKEIQSIEQWSEKTDDGTRSDAPFPISSSVWEKVGAEAESCNHVQCPHYKRCFFFKARKEAAEAQLLIVNHHLLLADIEKRRRNPAAQESILPPYDRLVIDEAHNLEEIALDSFARRFDRIAFLRLLAKLHSDVHPERSRLFALRKELASLSIVRPLLLQKLETEIPALRRTCQAELEEAFAKITGFFEDRLSKETKRRITAAITENPFWKGNVVPSLSSLAEQIGRLSLSLKGILSDFDEFKGTALYEKSSAHLLEIQSIVLRLEQAAEFFNYFTQNENQDQKRVRWYESNGGSTALVDAPLDISQLLNEHLFSTLRTSALCSATMAAARSFQFIKSRLGLALLETKLNEKIYDSPFNYPDRSLFLVPTDLPLPSHPEFLSGCIKAISEIVEISRGSAFLLFTSYEMLQSCYRALAAAPLSSRFPFLKQGDLPRHLLLEQFKNREGSVLFATDSFWEGVDVPGEALRCVVIAKLPFSVPSDPLYEAYAQSLEEEGLDPFLDYSVPQAVIKFKQGFGRLMRKNDDRGCVICLDPRIVKKGYGKQFLKSLPPCPTFFGPKSDVFTEMEKFYERTKKF